ncbi:hypothetical protein VB10N_37640 [Vibrio sp. 10N]|nr:hypothetical protein VB10N_37640 [Vibrio sp. 10N]
MCTRDNHDQPNCVITGVTMPTQQFEKLKEQLKQLSPQQLKALQGEISSQLQPSSDNLLSEEELAALSQLFR